MTGNQTVAVLGGGIGGLTAAHELGNRGVDVTVYEHNDRFGGKARSMPGPRDGGAALPAEHGFRFVPGFYQHLPDTMRRIPTDRGSVLDHLVSTETMLQSVVDGPSREFPLATPRTVSQIRERVQHVVHSQVPRDEAAFFANRLLTMLTSGDHRWDTEYEQTSWWEFVRADEMSPAYQTFLGYGLTQSLVAMRPEVSSARTIGRIYLQMIRGLFDPALDADRLLDGPTNDRFIDPWVAHLRDQGVTLHTNATVTGIDSDGHRVSGVAVQFDDGEAAETRQVTADHYVLAVPGDVVCRLLTPDLCAAAPLLAGVRDLDRGWMNGVQFYLREGLRDLGGHGVFYDAPWALTAVSQRQFWPDHDFDAYDDCEGVLSVIVSEWDTPGILYGKPARECEPPELLDEVWAQLQAHLGEDTLRDDDRLDAHLDPALSWDSERGGLRNDSTLLVNTVDTRQHRPVAATDCPNLVLAADYVRTETDLASMESANEAGRRAASAVLDRTGWTGDRPELWDFEWPAVVEPLRRQDDRASKLGLPHIGTTGDPLWDAYRQVGRTGVLGRFFSR
ncbi:hydroxysqualene dehydroxylase [Haloarchaeobius sp. DFWS5]|uniref:hydroxysqualene dehydroxylase n=1 Tax=Haloarchaeobius sp. DFWS5 TaxID=3446114 RepID=UPI003EBA682E